MTEDQLREIEERANEATPGPWYSWGADGVDRPFIGRVPHSSEAESIWLSEPEASTIEVFGQSEWLRARVADLAFIAHARDDVPMLLAHIREQADEITRLKDDANTRRMNHDRDFQRWQKRLSESAATMAELRAALDDNFGGKG